MIGDAYHELFMDRVEKLTGERWVPYPGDLFVDVVMAVPDEVAVSLIEERRKYLFPQFMRREPQGKRLEALATEHNVTVQRAG
jgi:hypothetical protein